MPANNKATLFLSGKIYWAKVTGDPVPNYGGDAREWTFEFEPDAEGLKQLKAHKLTDRLKDKENPDRKVLVLKQSEFRKDGKPNKHIRIYDVDDEEWNMETLIGNGSDADAKLDVRDYGVGKKKGVYPAAIRVTELVKYQSSEFGGMDKGGKPAAKKDKAPPKDDFKKDFGLAEDDEDLDDEVPF